MSNKPLQRGWPIWGALVIGVMALLLAAWKLAGSETQSTAQAAANPKGGTGTSSSPSGAPPPPPVNVPDEPLPEPDQLPMPGCWQGLAQLDQTLTLGNFRVALSAAISQGDRLLGEYLQEKLTELVGNNPEHALEVISWAEGASEPALGLYIEALKASAAVHNPRVVDRLVQVGANPKLSYQNRGAALVALESQRRLEPATMQRLNAIALDPSADSVAWIATRTIGRVMKEDFERTGSFRAYWDQLMGIAQKSEDPAVRLLALEMPSYSNPLLDAASVESIGEIMRTARERDVRSMAAFRLAVTEAPEKALEIYKNAFDAEQDLCVRWAIFRFALRAAGAQAFPLLQQFAARDQRFQREYDEFKELYADGTLDFARIWLGKKENIQCLVEEGSPH